jgi:hypothetical protein
LRYLSDNGGGKRREVVAAGDAEGYSVRSIDRAWANLITDGLAKRPRKHVGEEAVWELHPHGVL